MMPEGYRRIMHLFWLKKPCKKPLLQIKASSKEIPQISPFQEAPLCAALAKPSHCFTASYNASAIIPKT